MALHAGEAEERDEDYFGPAINSVAHIMSAANGAQVLMSAAAVELIKEALPQGVRLYSLGAHRLKDLSASRQLYQVLHPDLLPDIPAIKTLDSHPNNLPSQPSGLIG